MKVERGRRICVTENRNQETRKGNVSLKGIVGVPDPFWGNERFVFVVFLDIKAAAFETHSLFLSSSFITSIFVCSHAHPCPHKDRNTEMCAGVCLHEACCPCGAKYLTIAVSPV